MSIWGGPATPAFAMPAFSWVGGETGRLFRRGEVVCDEDVVPVVRVLPHPGAGAAVLAAEPVETVVDGPPGGVVVDLVTNHKCCGHLLLLLTPEASCFVVKTLLLIHLRDK